VVVRAYPRAFGREFARLCNTHCQRNPGMVLTPPKDTAAVARLLEGLPSDDAWPDALMSDVIQYLLKSKYIRS
jgi:hypothetical protein